MDPYSELRDLAREKRDAAIKAARYEYNQTLLAITQLSRKVRTKRAPRDADKRAVRQATDDDTPYSELTLVAAAERVLREGKPLRTVELALEVQNRGCRAGDDPRRVVNSIRTAFSYHPERFRRGNDGRWGVGDDSAS